MGPIAGRASSPAEVGENGFQKKRPVFQQNERMTEKQLFPRSGRVVMLAFRLGGKKLKPV